MGSGIRSRLCFNRRSDCKCLNILRRLCNAVWMQPLCASLRLGQQRRASLNRHCQLEPEHPYNGENHQSRDAQRRGQDPSRSWPQEPASAWVRVILCTSPVWGVACSRNQQDERPSPWAAWGPQVSGAICPLRRSVCFPGRRLWQVLIKGPAPIIDGGTEGLSSPVRGSKACIHIVLLWHSVQHAILLRTCLSQAWAQCPLFLFMQEAQAPTERIVMGDVAKIRSAASKRRSARRPGLI